MSGAASRGGGAIPSPARREVPELARAWTHKEVSSWKARSAKAGEAGGTSEYELRGEGTTEIRVDHDPHSLSELGVDESVVAAAKGAEGSE